MDLVVPVTPLTRAELTRLKDERAAPAEVEATDPEPEAPVLAAFASA